MELVSVGLLWRLLKIRLYIDKYNGLVILWKKYKKS